MMFRFRCSTRLLIALALTALAVPAPAEPTAEDPATLWQKVRSATLEPDRAVTVRSLKFNTGMADLEIREGTLFPAAPIGERTVEMVFIGSAKLTLEPPDEIEAGQLDLFTGSRDLDEEITEAALVITVDAATDALLSRPLAETDAATRDRAQEIFDTWTRRPERRLLGVASAIFRDALADPFKEGYFAGWFRGEELGEFLYLVEPDAPEQVRMGQFTSLEATQKEERKIKRELHRAKRKGRLIGLSVENLGVWDTWLSTARVDAQGAPRPGTEAFEPEHYELDLALTGRELELKGRTRIHLRALSSVARVVRLLVHSDLRIRRAAISGGEEVFFRQSEDVELADPLAEVLVVLPTPPAADGRFVIELEYSGLLLNQAKSKTWALGDTIYWHPHAGTVDRATYDVTFHWPADLDLMCGGKLVDRGTEAGQRRFERRRIERRTFGTSFEIGRFRKLTGKAGDVSITLAIDSQLAKQEDKKSQEVLLETIIDSVGYFEETFGPYPLDELVVVTAPRGFSQSLLGFMTLASLGMTEEGLLTFLLGFEDRRAVIAHEVAHQWWGHVVPWKSYRDQWISEAMANYAAMLYARHRLDGVYLRGPTFGWQRALTSTVAGGRPIESLGPLVLGERLSSSRSANAYQAIVYQKGAVVLDMLARAYGEKAFVEILHTLTEAVAFRPISTADFVTALERITGNDLGGFADQFIYGTGLPEVYYSYEFEPAADKWRVRGVARQSSPYRYAYRVVERDGSFDVLRSRLDQTELSASTLFVPVQIAIFKPDAKQGTGDKKRGLDPRQVGNAMVMGRLALRGESSDFAFELDYEPKELWLDRKEEVFGRFYNESRHPKRMLFYRGYDQASAGEHAEAEQLYRDALAADVFSGPSYNETRTPKELEQEAQRLDTWIRLRLVRLYLDQGRTTDARTTFDRLERGLGGGQRRAFKNRIRYLEARLAINEGDHETAYALLNKKALRRSVRGSTEGLLLLAIAARETGRTAESESAVEDASEKGADVTTLAGS
ncbi:MAG: hypothetical protein GY719_01475 [bacterium]|nr:hypothetical protein [bacterium]